MRQRRIWVAATTVVAVTAGVLAFQGMTDRTESGILPDSKAGPIKPEARTAQLAIADEGRSASLPQRDTERFSMLGVTWTDPAARFAGTVEVRTRSAESGKWSNWLQLEGDTGQGERAAERGGTEPAWGWSSNGVEVRMRAGNGATSAKLPAGLRLDMIDPGSGKVTGIEPAAFAVEETTQPTPRDRRPTRKSLRRARPRPGPIRAAKHPPSLPPASRRSRPRRRAAPRRRPSPRRRR